MRQTTSKILFLLFSLAVFISCKEKKNTEGAKNQTEIAAKITYQCPMDCEDGKVYHKQGNCPVCKMDLKALDGDTMTCSIHKDGNCQCAGKKCACENCSEHGKATTCSMHKDGNCKCEGKKCTCKNCPTHS